VDIPGSLGIALVVSTFFMPMYAWAEYTVGTPREDNSKGTPPASAAIVGKGGSDDLDGRGGNDVIAGNEGDDGLLGTEGNEYLRGNGSNDNHRGEELIASLVNGNITVGESNPARSNPEFTIIDNQSGIIGYGLPSYWEDSSKSCVGNFECSANFTTGWRDNTSLQVSTKTNTKNTWSSIYSKEIDVNPTERFGLITHMKLNDFANSSHIVMEASNETSKNWTQINQCPIGRDGPLEWRQFSCEIIVPDNASKVRLVLNAGWSSQENEEAVTLFDEIYMIRLPDVNSVSNVSSVPTIINDPNLKTEVVTRGLKSPTTMAFLGPDDILVLEKNNGTVRRVTNGTILPEPLLDVNVGNARERGMLGIAIAPKNENDDKNRTTSSNTTNTTRVFLYFTESKDDNNDSPENKSLSNRLYRFDLKNNKLVNPKLLLELPFTSTTIHNGGVILIGPDNNIYTVVGDLEGSKYTKAQNRYGPDPDGRSGILRITQNGQLVNGTGILGDEHPLDMYYAYGIRNSFGMDFDPITGKLWDTENGPSYSDEINLVEPGFNSGWEEIAGSSRIWGAPRTDALEDFGGKGNYSDPEYEWSEKVGDYEWSKTVGPTALKFLDSDRLGKQYENDMFVGDFNYGRIYHFELNNNRTKLNTDGEYRLNEKTIFAEGFGGVTDIEAGPDGYLYIVSYGKGVIYRIVPSDINSSKLEPSAIIGSVGSGDGQFRHPHGLATDSIGNIYVTVRDNTEVQKFTKNGTFITKWGSNGTADGQFRDPHGIDIDSSGNVFVSDAAQRGSNGTREGEFDIPYGIAVNSDKVHVSDSLNHRIQEFTSSGTFITQWGSQGSRDGEFNHPEAIELDPSGHLYVSDAHNDPY
jgi:aldose sugar dehydrogenase